MILHSLRFSGRFVVMAAICAPLVGCAAAVSAPAWPESARKWFERAQHSLSISDLEDAERSSAALLKELPADAEARMLAAEVALAGLDFDSALAHAKGLPGAPAAAVRGRAYWYKGELEAAANELETLTADPDIRDPWAADVVELARSGQGRRPFEMHGGLLAAVRMDQKDSPAMIVPVEVNGKPCLALVATDSAEAVIHAPSRQPAWVSLRFASESPDPASRSVVDVSDVPVVGRDLSGLKREFGPEIELLLGTHLLRHLRPTIDFSGQQFVVRSFNPPAPPEATTLHPVYHRGAAMTVRVGFQESQAEPDGALLVHTSMSYPVALDEAGWKRQGANPAEFANIPGRNGVKQATLPFLRLGAYELHGIPGVFGARIDEVEKNTRTDLDGFAGSGLFSTFRLTLADDGKTLWVEGLPDSVLAEREAAAAAAQQRAAATSQPTPPPAPPAGSQPGPATPAPAAAAAPGPAPLPASAPARGGAPAPASAPARTPAEAPKK